MGWATVPPVPRPCSQLRVGKKPDPAMAEEAVWTIPEPVSTCEVRLDESTVTTVRRHGNPSSPRLLLTHGNGLAVDLYYPFWSLLAGDFDLMVYDLRNHGWNDVGPRRDHNIPTLISDHDLILDAISREYGEKPTVGVFHSLATLMPLLSLRNRYSALVLFDPPLCKPGASQIELHEAAESAAEMIRKRGYRFKTREAFAEFLGILPTFARVAPGVHELMARTTLRQSASDEQYELRCPREYEAQLMDYGRSFFPLLDLDLLYCPTKVIGGDPTIRNAYLPTFDLGQVSAVDYDFLPEATHLLQLERPEECAELLREFLERHRVY